MGCIFEARCEGAVKEEEIGQDKLRQHDNRAVFISQVLSLFQTEVQTGLRDMGTEQVRQLLCVRIAMALYLQKDDCVHHKLHRVFVDSRLFI